MKYNALLGALLCAILWGSAFPCIKLIYRHWEEIGLETTIYHRWLIAGLRFLIAGIALWFCAKRPWEQIQAIWRRKKERNLLIGMTAGQTFVQYFFFYSALAVSSGALAALFTGCGTLWWLILAPLVLKTPWPRPITWGAITLGIAGVITASYAPSAFEKNPQLGALLLVLATGSGAIGLVCYQKLGSIIGSRTATAFSLFWGGGALCLVGLPAMPDILTMHHGPVGLVSIWLTIVSAFAFSLWNYLATKYPVSELANYRLFIPIAGLIESVIWIPNEHLSWQLFIGSILVISAAAIARKFAR